MNTTAEKKVSLSKVDYICGIAILFVDQYGWDYHSVSTSMLVGIDAHGADFALGILGFIKESIKKNSQSGWIGAQVGHDLNISYNPKVCPRTIGYAKYA